MTALVSPSRIAVKDALTGSVTIFEMAAGERLPLTFDLSPLLADGEQVESATAELVDRRTDALYAAGLYGAIAIDDTGALVTQAVVDLAPGGRYRLKMRCVVGSVKRWEPYLDIDCLG